MTLKVIASHPSKGYLSRITGQSEDRHPFCPPFTHTRPLLTYGHHVYIVTSSPMDGWKLLKHPGTWGEPSPCGSMQIWAVNRNHKPPTPFTPCPSPQPLTHSTDPKRREILEARRVHASPSPRHGQGRSQALRPWILSPAQSKRAFP